MRGKKSDQDFITKFIQESVLEGHTTIPEIVQRAKDELHAIDDKIKEIENLKIRRSKILDVLFNLDKSKKDKTQENSILPLFDLQYPDFCKLICCALKDKEKIIVNNSSSEYIFAIKQMLNHKIVCLTDNYLSKGDNFDEYVKIHQF